MVEKIKKELRTPKGQLVFILGLAVLTSVVWLALDTITSAAPSKKDIREIVFEIRNMTFGDNNPTVYMQPGETVRFTIHNLEQGMKHNFTIENTKIATQLLSYGDKASVTYTAPDQQENRDYFCMPHASMMRGKLIVTNEMIL